MLHEDRMTITTEVETLDMLFSHDTLNCEIV